MRARTAISAAAFAAALCACRAEPDAASERAPAAAGAPERGPDGPSVLLVTVDSLRADHLGCYGYARRTSPVVDRLAAEGALFEVAIAQAPWTLPSLSSLLTSLLPVEVGATRSDGRLAEGAVTAAELFRGAGYATAAFTIGAYTERSRGFGQGFDVYENLDRTHPGAELSRRALAWLDGVRGRPFFLWVHYFDVHADYAAPAPWNRLFDDTPPAPEVARIDSMARVVNGNLPLAPGDLARIVTSYDREIACADAAFGELWSGLEGRGLAGRTALAFGADHGEGFMEHGLLLHTLSVFDEFVRVPLVLRLPGRVPAGRRVARQVRNLDVLPTLLELAGVDPPPGARGRSLLPLLEGAAGAGWPPAPTHTDTSGQEEHYRRTAELRPGLFDTFFAVRSSAAKLVYSVKEARYRLYELGPDPGELRDVFAERGAGHPELRGELDALRAIAPPPAGDAPPAVLSPTEIEQLRQLGYAR